MIAPAGIMPAHKRRNVMERPSHISFHSSQSLSRRLTALGLAFSFPLSVLFALTHGMTGHRIVDPGNIHFIPDRDATRPKPPPPPPFKPEGATQIKVPEPSFRTLPEQGDDHGITATVSGPDDHVQQPPTGIDRAPAGVMSTHTRPPYPLLAQRLGAEGKVTLRLTVLADGRVGQAEIVTSSGRSDLDDTARDWILSHWTYKPALEKGQPAAGQVLATIVFSLRNER
jgi:TonB family protein